MHIKELEMRTKKILTGMLTAFALAATLTVAAQQADRLPPIEVKEFNMKNGMHVVLHPDKSTPIVTVGTRYHIDSKNETPGRTGFAKICEHMMLQGSANYDNDYFTPLQEA